MHTAYPAAWAICFGLCFATTAETATIDFESVPVGTVYGAPSGDLPSDVVLSQEGIDMSVELFRLGGFVQFFRAEVGGIYGGFFPTTPIGLNNISLRFDFADDRRTMCRKTGMVAVGPEGDVVPGQGNMMHLTATVSSDVLRSWTWHLLGDASTRRSDSAPAPAQGPPLAPGLPLAASGTHQVEEGWTMTAEVVSFTPAFDPTVRDAAEAKLEQCAPLPVRSLPGLP